MGIRVGGGSGIFAGTLVDAQLVGFVNSTLRFHAEAQASTSSSGGSSASYLYGVYLLYNLGYGGYANIPLFSWYATPRNLFPTPKQVTLYENSNVVSTTNAKRELEATPKLPRRGLLNSYKGGELEPAADLSYHVSGSESLLFRRQSLPGSIGQVSTFDFATLFQCPDGGNGTCSASPLKRDEQAVRRAPTVNCPAVLPEFRCKLRVSYDIPFASRYILLCIMHADKFYENALHLVRRQC